MTERNIQMKNKNGEIWDMLFPLTKEANITDSAGKKLSTKITEISSNFNVLATRTLSVTDIKEYGVKGDGSDETALIEKAIKETNGLLKFSAGSYLISKPIVRTTSNLHIEFAEGAEIYFNGLHMEKAISFVGSEGTSGTLMANVLEGADTLRLTTIPTDWNVNDWLEINSTELWSNARPDYNKIEYVKIKSIDRSTNTVTIYAGTTFGYTYSVSHTVKKQNFLQNVGVSGMKLRAPESVSTWGVSFERTEGAKIIGNDVKYAQAFGIDVRNSVDTIVQGNNVVVTTDRDQLNYAICFTSVQYGNIVGNTLFSFRTSIDISRSSSFNNVNNNTSLQGDINTHNSLKNNMNDNTINSGKMYIRGPYHNVIGNTIRCRDLAEFQGGIMLQEAADIGGINIIGNIIDGSADAPLSNGVYCTLLNIKDVTVSDNYMFNVARGVMFAMPDNNATANNITVRGNRIRLKDKANMPSRGIQMNRVSKVLIEGNQITGDGASDGRGVEFYASGSEFKNISVIGNQFYDLGDPVNIGNYHKSVLIANNIADGCTGNYVSTAANRKFSNNILNSAHVADSAV